MIKYEEFTLDNGLQVIVHEDHALPIAVLNILYKVGSRDEQEHKTGFAHLFEHLMFGGSVNVRSFDEPLQKVGGENNAFTSTDITNYYISLPALNIETAFWLESDRMLGLAFEEKILEVQRNVVIEEYKQRYLNQPYGDVWLKLRPLAYKVHPYRWPTIGKDISHIETATMDDVRAFFRKFYIPNNAILVVAGDVRARDIRKLTEKWFGPVPPGPDYNRNLPYEPVQKKTQKMKMEADVPLDAIYMAFHMAGRGDESYHSVDLLSDILGRGKTSRLYQELVRRKHIFNSINAYVTSSIDPGLAVVSGKIKNGISPLDAEAEVHTMLEDIKRNGPSDHELQKVKNQAYTSLAFQDVELLSRAMNLAFFANLGNPEMINEEQNKIRAVKLESMIQISKEVFSERNMNILYYNHIKT